MEQLIYELHTLNELLATHFSNIDAPKYGWLDDNPYDKIMFENYEAYKSLKEEEKKLRTDKMYMGGQITTNDC